MTASSLPRRWYRAGTNLEAWGEAGTYEAIAYEALPPLSVTRAEDGPFAWLRGAPVSPHGLDFGDAGDEADENNASNDARLALIVSQAMKMGLTVPPALVAFFGHSELHRRVPSCTACYLDVPTRLIELPGGHPGRLLRFMNDQRCCRLWYVHLEPGGGHSIVSAAPEWVEGAVGEALEDVVTPCDVEMCAPSFEAFIHRYWLESSLWFAVRKGTPLTDEQNAYAALLAT